MLSLSQFGGRRATASIVNRWSGSAGAAPTGLSTFGVNAKLVLSGAMTATVWKTLLTVSAAGDCTALGAYANDVTSRVVGMRITVDGVVVFTGTTSATANAGEGLLAATGSGSTGTANNNIAPGIVFNTSLVVELQSSLTETDKLTLAYLLNTL